MGHEIPNIGDYLGTLETLAYNTHYDLDLSDAPHVVLRPNSRCVYPESEMPTIYGDYETDGERFWFEPRMEFPKILKDNMFEDGYHSHMEHWGRVAKLADYLVEHSWYIDVED